MPAEVYPNAVSGLFDLVVDGKLLNSYALRLEADEAARRMNSKLALEAIMTGGGAAVSINSRDVQNGCTCARGVQLPGDPPCPVHQ